MTFEIISTIDLIIEKLQGIGYGSSSIKNEVRTVKKILTEGSVFVDVGGNKGLYSQELLNNFNVKELHIFEPSIVNQQILRSKFKNNSNVFLNTCGLADYSKKSNLYSDFEGSGLASLSKRRLDHFNIDMSIHEEIQLMRFDEYWKNKNNKIDLFKIDVEGHELSVLNGIGDYINSIKVIQFEFGGCNIDTRTFFQDYWYFFKNIGFSIFRITPIGFFKIHKYKESYERFKTTNYICVNELLFKI